MPEEIPKQKKVINFEKAKEELAKKKEAERLRKLGEAGPETEMTEPPASHPDAESEPYTHRSETIDTPGLSDYADSQTEKAEFALKNLEINLHEMMEDPRHFVRLLFEDGKQPEDVQKLMDDMTGALTNLVFFSARVPRLQKVSERITVIIAACTNEIQGSQPHPESSPTGLISRIFGRAKAPEPPPTDPEYARRISTFRDSLRDLQKKIDVIISAFPPPGDI